MEINNSQIEIGKGFRLHDFYYYLLLSDFTISQLKTEIKKLMLFFKSFANYTYQSCEGKADKKPLYKECQECEKELAFKIAQNTKEWNEGKWE